MNPKQLRIQWLRDIRALCIAAHPDILEFKFGCRLLEESTGRDFTILGMTPAGDPITMDTPGIYDATKPAGASVEQIESKKSVIGRSIRLADVIAGLNHKKQDYLPDGTIAMLCQVYWDLKKDDLDLQDDETLNWIATL